MQEFIAGADLYYIRKQYPMAAFMLHQATEQALRAMLIINTGLRINTHNIERLIRYCSMFSHKLPDIFNKGTLESKRLFELLQSAYIQSRYSTNYHVTPSDIIQLTQKIRTLQQLLHTLS
jgi:HEPN domain-containing protein